MKKRRFYSKVESNIKKTGFNDFKKTGCKDLEWNWNPYLKTNNIMCLCLIIGSLFSYKKINEFNLGF